MKATAFKNKLYGQSSDRRVEQIGNVLTNADYEILLSGTANDDYYIGETRKTASLTYNPSTKKLKIDGADIAMSATTLAGYGITDAKIENGTITLGSNTITPLTSHQDISGKVDKTGSYMTGILSHTQSTIDISTAPSSIQYGKGTNLLDKNNKGVGFYDSCQWADGTIATRLYAMRAVGNTTYYNGIQLKIASDGTGDIYVDNANKWRVALGLNTRAGSASDGGNAYTADKLTGFSGRGTTQTWGVQIGTVLTSMFDSNNGGWGFRTNCPSDNKLSSIIDGYYYQNEGNYRCLDTSDGCINSVSGNTSGGYGFYAVGGGGASVISHAHYGAMACNGKYGSKTSETSTTSTSTLESFSITTHGRPLLVFASGVVKTSRYTSGFRVNIGGTDRLTINTNRNEFTSVSGFNYVSGISAGTYTVKLNLVSQDTGTTATMPSYNAYSVMVMELP